jgi:hypothetical protein
MAIVKAASCVILASTVWASATEFRARHEHLFKGCDGVMTVDETGLRFSGPKGHKWNWKYQDIQELRLEPRKIHVLTYQDVRYRPGADRTYEFTGDLPVEELFRLWSSRMDQRFVAALVEPEGEDFAIPVKHLTRFKGSEGILSVYADSIVYSTEAIRESRTWRFLDIDNISSSGPFQLTITTFERAGTHYGDRKGFNFELKEPLTEARYNQLWLEIEKKNGRIQ